MEWGSIRIKKRTYLFVFLLVVFGLTSAGVTAQTIRDFSGSGPDLPLASNLPNGLLTDYVKEIDRTEDGSLEFTFFEDAYVDDTGPFVGKRYWGPKERSPYNPDLVLVNGHFRPRSSSFYRQRMETFDLYLWADDRLLGPGAYLGLKPYIGSKINEPMFYEVGLSGRVDSGEDVKAKKGCCVVFLQKKQASPPVVRERLDLTVSNDVAGDLEEHVNDRSDKPGLYTVSSSQSLGSASGVERWFVTLRNDERNREVGLVVDRTDTEVRILQEIFPLATTRPSNCEKKYSDQPCEYHVTTVGYRGSLDLDGNGMDELVRLYTDNTRNVGKDKLFLIDDRTVYTVAEHFTHD